MRRTIAIFVTLTSLILGILWYGLTIPVQYEASRTAHFNIKPLVLWYTLTDYGKYAQWRENIYAIEKLPIKEKGFGSWKEVDADGNTVPFMITKQETKQNLTIETIKELTDKKLTWVLEFRPDEDYKGATITFIERGEINDLLARVISHYFVGHNKNIDAFIRSINNKFIQEAEQKKIEQQKSVTQETPQ